MPMMACDAILRRDERAVFVSYYLYAASLYVRQFSTDSSFAAAKDTIVLLRARREILTEDGLAALASTRSDGVK